MANAARFTDPLVCLCRFTATTVHVACPGCGARAAVVPVPGTDPFAGWRRRLECARCARVEDVELTISGPRYHVDERSFPARLWLQRPCCGHTLWALNEPHLDLLESYVGAGLRERGTTHGTLSLVESLPAWIKRAANRDGVRHGIARLRERLADPG